MKSCMYCIAFLLIIAPGYACSVWPITILPGQYTKSRFVEALQGENGTMLAMGNCFEYSFILQSLCLPSFHCHRQDNFASKFSLWRWGGVELRV